MPIIKTSMSKYFFYLLVCTLLFIGAFLLSLRFGAAKIDFEAIRQAIFTTKHSASIDLLREIRLPRSLAALIVGAALAIAGALIQGLTHNPIAEPSILGLSSGAYACYAFSLVLLPNQSYLITLIVCMLGAALTGWLVLGLANHRTQGLSPMRLILTGAAISILFNALAQMIGLSFQLTKDLSMWTASGVNGVNWAQLKVIFPFGLLGGALAFYIARPLTLLALSEETAIGLGQNIRKIRLISVIAIILLTASSVALAGNLTFVGLMIPQIIRRLAGSNYQRTLPLSALTGASFLMLADTIARTIHAPYETPLIAIVSVVGFPFFIYLVKKEGTK